jgi:hypothetical protein
LNTIASILNGGKKGGRLDRKIENNKNIV